MCPPGLGSIISDVPNFGEHTTGVKFALQKGADINALDRHGANALSYAVMIEGAGAAEMVELLYQNGAQATHGDSNFSPLVRAARFGTPEALSALLNANGAGYTPTRGERAALVYWLKSLGIIEIGTDRVQTILS